MSQNKDYNPSEKGKLDNININKALSSEVSSIAGSVKTAKTPQRTSSSEKQLKFERAQKCLENAALVSKRIKEHRKATAELLGRPFEEDDGGDNTSEMASTMSERTGYSAATDTSTTLSVQEALNIPGISESLANTLKQKELLMEKIKQYKEISKRPINKSTSVKKDSITESKIDLRKNTNNDQIQLMNTIKEKENSLSIIQVKMKAMEATILDLQEKINEKDQIIEAKNMATTLMSDSLSKKEKDTIVLLEDTRQQMTKMQENFVIMESEWKDEKQKLVKELEKRDERINSLVEANIILENSRFEISVAHTQLVAELESKNEEIAKLENMLQNISHTQIDEESSAKIKDDEEEKGSREIAAMTELTKKIDLLEQLNCQIRQTNKELENKLATINIENKSPASSSPSKKASPLPTRKGARNTASKMKSPWSKLSTESLSQEQEKKSVKSEKSNLDMVVSSLNKDILEKEYEISQKDAEIAELKCQVQQKETIINELELTTQTVKTPSIDMTDVGVCTEAIDDNTKYSNLMETTKESCSEVIDTDENQSLHVAQLESSLKTAQDQIAVLTEEIDTANKNMIKVKSNNKIKLKQLQKTIENLSKVSDANAEIVKLNEELHQLSQKVAELEEEKGNLQLHLVDYDSGRLTESDIYKKMIEKENLAEIRLKAISVLETQKFDLVQELHTLQQKNIEMEDKLADLTQFQNEQVCSEMKCVQLEEQVDTLIASRKELELVIQNLKLDKEQLNGTIQILQEEKEDMMHKLENYIQENIELTDKLEKLSAEKVSSAESIEIVESLTTQEKLELEEYNKRIVEENVESKPPKSHESVATLIEQSTELNNKIELFTQERQEVMEKMTKINTENMLLNKKIDELNKHCHDLQNKVEELTNEKQNLHVLNEELSQQIEIIKKERLEIIKETVDLSKPALIDEVVETGSIEAHHDEKVGDKGNNRTKSVKQLTKEILKLKNTIKEREDEIADCQMKILSLEEQQQKQTEFLQTTISYESKIKSILDENSLLKDEVDRLTKEKESNQEGIQYKQAHEELQQEIEKRQQELITSVNQRDSRINELEQTLLDYEQQLFNYGNTLQQKEKELTEYSNQITKLNDVSQKLKSTIDLLEEEKAKDQNADLIKSLNKQISVYQKKLLENEEKIQFLEEEKSQLYAHKNTLENKNICIDKELKNLQDVLAEKQNLIKEIQTQQQKYMEDMSTANLQAKERDEEIHEIKLQLRKESIENEKLRTIISDKIKTLDECTQQLEKNKEELNQLIQEKENLHQQFELIESKNKELMEKLKKYAVNFKRKSSMYTELEARFTEVQKQLEAKNERLDQLLIQVDTLPTLQEKLKHADEEINRIQSQKFTLEQQKYDESVKLQTEIKNMEEKLIKTSKEIANLNDSLQVLQEQLRVASEEKINMKNIIDSLTNKITEYEIEQKNNINFITKINTLEADLNIKQNKISELLSENNKMEQEMTQAQFGYSAKVQEKDLYIESLETEISKYKNRICRLEESISVMEDRRCTLERKADQLGSQLQEKQKAYSDYTSQEDKLVNRLAVLMDHDRVVEKQLYEIENDNKELHFKIQHIDEENQRLRKSLSDIQDYCNTLVDKASRTDQAEIELVKCQSRLNELETHLKQITYEHQTSLTQKKQDIEELELEFNTQIENAIKEKKTLSEKYEKISDHVSQLEERLKEYKTTITHLNINNEDLNKINNELLQKSNEESRVQLPDYTEQYVSEINRLNSVVNSKNEEISVLNNTIQKSETTNMSITANLEDRILELTDNLQIYGIEIEKLTSEIKDLQRNNEELNSLLSQKDEQIKELKEKQKLTFEMNIPKTEGMLISSTIEAVSEEPKNIDMSSLESQIISDIEPAYSDYETKKQSIDTKKQSYVTKSSGEISEPVVVPKKTYLCYSGEETVVNESDPFNSDEGWGLEACEEIADVTPGLSHLNNQIEQLKKDNERLKKELDTNNTKLLKAIKKLKELKSKNDVLVNELKVSKQLSQSSFIDTAIEDELRNKVQELENKLCELNIEMTKEKKEKDYLRKQKDIFQNANDRLTEMKEKLENEIEIWKYKFKEANDKVTSMQWSEDNNYSPQRKPSGSTSGIFNEDQLNNEIMKIEKENDELQSMVDQLTSQNKELTLEKAELNDKLLNLTEKMSQQRICENCVQLKNQLIELESKNTELENSNKTLNEKLQQIKNNFDELQKSYQAIINSGEEVQRLENENRELSNKCTQLDGEIMLLKNTESEARKEAQILSSELEIIKTRMLFLEQQTPINKDQEALVFALTEKCSLMEQHTLELKGNLQDATNKILRLETENLELIEKIRNYDNQVSELNQKVQNLNTENDSLLSTVAELRSSVSSAVDQRGFEIAELWKQHLAQREADFQQLEQDLRAQLNVSESKYEQLLDNVQSSSQEDTNKIVVKEQISSLQLKIQEKEEHLRNLQDKYSDVLNQLDILRSEMQDEKVNCENKLLEQQEEYEKVIQQFTSNKEKHLETYEQTIKDIKSELSVTKAASEELNQQVEFLNKALVEAESKIDELTKEIRSKESDIYQKTHEYTITLSQRNEEFENIRKLLLEYEKKVEDLNYEKESELAVLRLKMHENNERYEKAQSQSEIEKDSLTDTLNLKIVECTNLNKQIIDLNQTLEEYSNKAAEMQTALENQELEIVTLKDEIKNLQDIIAASTSKIEKHVRFTSDTKPGSQEETSELLHKQLLDPVPRAELDLALYMLHQRDVRCEELTMELTQLLEERDTLQLRLSDSLRSHEELKAKCKSVGLDTSMSSSQETITEQPNYSIDRETQFVDTHRGQTSRSSSISDFDGEKPNLQAKLSELRSVKHSRDVRLRHESEQRQLDLRLLQRDVANLPPEAVDQLTQAHHTLSRDSQSTSTVLLNWLRGKSTPKVVHM